MKLIYIPDVGFTIDDHLENRIITWNDQREHICKTILKEYSYKRDDRIYDALELSQKRDIYHNDEVFFVLSFDISSNCLKELEIHHGIDVEVNGVVITFGEKMTTIAQKLGIQPTILDDGGTYLFSSLKITISNDRVMGADDDGSDTMDSGNVAYFYASNNIDHLV
ncbi:unnamed protein product [Adineta steineri]|uniref:Uncharacterized protein n=1 Tax=Adineta steineri TaxID=433720 RepID=A0A815QBD6_9BILA|nr:unnamed protein product [Adineta steineri]CAF3974661.1 unnamed protein product [Adineta steineri]